MNIFAIAIVSIIPFLARAYFARRFPGEKAPDKTLHGSAGVLMSLPVFILGGLSFAFYKSPLRNIDLSVIFTVLAFGASSVLAYAFLQRPRFRFQIGIVIAGVMVLLACFLHFILPSEFNSPGELIILSVYCLGFEIGFLLCGRVGTSISKRR